MLQGGLRILQGKAREFARRGFRSLGVAVKKDDEPWELLGMFPMFDPPREDTAHTIAEAQVPRSLRQDVDW